LVVNTEELVEELLMPPAGALRRVGNRCVPAVAVQKSIAAGMINAKPIMR
jgi:hypothetical protein